MRRNGTYKNTFNMKWVKTSWKIQRDQNVCARFRLIMKAWKFKTYFGNCQCVWWIMWNIYTFNLSIHCTMYTNEASQDGSDCVSAYEKRGEKERCVKQRIRKWKQNTKETARCTVPSQTHTHKSCLWHFFFGFHLISHSENLKCSTLYYQFTHKCQFLIQSCSQSIK